MICLFYHIIILLLIEKSVDDIKSKMGEGKKENYFIFLLIFFNDE